MGKLLKYGRLIILGKNLRKAYREDTGKEGGWMLSRRVQGCAVALAGGFMAAHYGVELTPDMLAQITANVDKFASSAAFLIGFGRLIWGIIDRDKGGKK